jgi:hypothetical protein
MMAAMATAGMATAMVGTEAGMEPAGLQETPATAATPETEETAGTAATPEIVETMAAQAIAAAVETQELKELPAITAALTAMRGTLEIRRETTATATATAGVPAMRGPVKVNHQAKEEPLTPEEHRGEEIHPLKVMHPGTAALRAPQPLEGCRAS